MDLEDELNRLFKDDRMDVQVAANADKTVVAGARRVRRRRVALVSAAGAVCAVALAAGTLVIIGPSGPPTSIDEATQPSLTITSPEPTTATTPDTPGPQEQPGPAVTTSRPASSTQSSRQAPPVGPSEPMPSTILGPAGYGRLTLGMSEADLMATGLALPDSRDGTCTQYRIKSGGFLKLSAANGLMDINPAAAVTPERITIGATTQQVREVYPNLTVTDDASQAKVPGNANAVYRFTFMGGQVSGIHLRSTNYTCG